MKKINLSITSLFLFCAAALQAQVNLQNTGTLYISGATDILYVNGSLTNASAAGLNNNGQLYISQNLVNSQAGMAVGTGTLYLNGSAAQTVSGTQLFRTFNMITDNSAGFILNNDLSVSGAHTFTAGIITTSATPNYLIYEAGSSFTGDGDTRHVNGWVRKTGNTAFTFPLGNGTVERRIAARNLAASSVFNARYMGATTNTTSVLSPLVNVDPNEYWMVNQVSGGTAIIDMNWDNSKIAMPNYSLADIRVANYTAGNWTQVGGTATGNTSTTGSISSNTLSSFGAFTFGSISFILPVTLVEFSAYRTNGNTLLSWTTTGEINVSHYEAERSEDGMLFYAAGAIAANNKTGLQQYSLTDSKPLTKETTYYRLRSVDTDGKTKISKVVMVRDRLSSIKYFAVGNPVSKSIHITAGLITNGTYSYRIISGAGQTVQSGRLNLGSGAHYELPLLSSVTPGIYVLELRKDNYNYRQQLLVQ
ncbi:MAG: T9SS type A sorting domain-containing protein [Chitinophagaceae bacterium]